MTKKKSEMQKEVEKTETAPGEQMPLIDVGPQNSKLIIKHARIYKAFQKQRMEALAGETKHKQILLDIIHKEKIKPNDSGKIQFNCESFKFTVTPSKETISISEADDKDEKE